MTYMHPTWLEINWWIDKMVSKYGGIAYDIDGRTWDWGQALCRVVYGRNWSANATYLKDQLIESYERAPQAALDLINLWDDDYWPEEIINPNETT